jgi:Peptidase family C25
VDTVGPQFNTRKIFTGAFPLVSTPNGRRSPATRDAINRQVEEGTLIMNYTGHGGETGWSSESILDIVQVNNWQNLDRLPLFVTATCEFGRFDNPEQRSGAEYTIISPRGGGIAILTTTRPVFSSTNFILNEAFYRAVFARTNGQMPRLGDVQRLTKNGSISGVINRNFALLGDPSLRLAYPGADIALTTAQTAGSGADTLKALGRAVLRGEVRQDGRLDANFNGTVDIEVFDKRAVQRTRADGEDDPIDFAQFSRTLFRGTASVRGGRFEVNFTVPKDIVYAYGPGRIALYARDSVRNLDAAGFKNNLMVGGTAPNFAPDNQAPQVDLWLDSEQFIDGGIVRPNTRLLARLRDDSGITVSGTGIGRDLVATLDGRQTYILNDLYQANRDDPRQGRLTFDLTDLAEGPHILQLKAWDTHNNSGEATIRFVVEREAFAVAQVVAYPNPFNPASGPLNFRFRHNKPGEDLRLDLKIYSSIGQLVKQIEGIDYNVPQETENLTWDGLSGAGTPLANGVYLYRLTVQPLREGGSPAVLSGRIGLFWGGQ